MSLFQNNEPISKRAGAGGMFTCTSSNTIRRSGIRRNDMCDFKLSASQQAGARRGLQKLLVWDFEPQLGCLLADLCFGAPQEGGNVRDSAPVLDPILKREQFLFGPLFAALEIRLFRHATHPNTRTFSFVSLHA
jgi:hypothetical protein